MSFRLEKTGSPEEIDQHAREEATRIAGAPHHARAASVIFNGGILVEETARKLQGPVSYVFEGELAEDGSGYVLIHAWSGRTALHRLLDSLKVEAQRPDSPTRKGEPQPRRRKPAAAAS